jgi:hypothetical protein
MSDKAFACIGHYAVVIDIICHNIFIFVYSSFV